MKGRKSPGPQSFVPGGRAEVLGESRALIVSPEELHEEGEPRALGIPLGLVAQAQHLLTHLHRVSHKRLECIEKTGEFTAL